MDALSPTVSQAPGGLSQTGIPPVFAAHPLCAGSEGPASSRWHSGPTKAAHRWCGMRGTRATASCSAHTHCLQGSWPRLSPRSGPGLAATPMPQAGAQQVLQSPLTAGAPVAAATAPVRPQEGETGSELWATPRPASSGVLPPSARVRPGPRDGRLTWERGQCPRGWRSLWSRPAAARRPRVRQALCPGHASMRAQPAPGVGPRRSAWGPRPSPCRERPPSHAAPRATAAGSHCQRRSRPRPVGQSHT